VNSNPRCPDKLTKGSNWYHWRTRVQPIRTNLSTAPAVLPLSNKSKTKRGSIPHASFASYTNGQNYGGWRTRVQPIRTASEITANIVIPANITIALHKIFAVKAKQLHMLEISYKQIGRSLNISQKTARRTRSIAKRY